MTLRIRPSNHPERSQVSDAVEAYRISPNADAILVAKDDLIFRAPRHRLRDARLAHAAASATALAASHAADSADDLFDNALRSWVATVRSPEGRSLAQNLSPLAGGLSPSEISVLPYRQEIDRAGAFLARLVGCHELHGNPAALAELHAALAALEPAVTADEEATRHRVALGRVLAELTAEFDGAYAKFARTAQALLGEDAWHVLPRFSRAAPPAAAAP